MEPLPSLVTRARAGDLAAYGQIVRRFQDMAHGYAYALVGDFHLAEDAAQDAFVEAYRDLDKLREPAAFPGWFRRIVFKRCDRLTRGKRPPTVPLDAGSGRTDGAPGPAHAVAERELKQRVLAAIRALPERERTVTALYYIDGYSQGDIADFLEVPVSTVKSRLHTSRSRLKEGMLPMIDQALKSSPLPDRFADVVVQMNTVNQQINPLAAHLRACSDADLRRKSADLRQRLADGQDRATVRPEAFALVREATRRAWGWPHYDIQLVAAMIMDEGWIAEEATGEGKTITCFPAAYMAALEGLHVHVATVNQYLAERDAGLARRVFDLLGVSVGCIRRDDGPEPRRQAYACDITYASNAELGFDSLRDQMEPATEPVQPRRDFAIIDEADSILIDEARTPLIISGPGETALDACLRADAVAQDLMRRAESGEHVYEPGPQQGADVVMTPEGLAVADQAMGIEDLDTDATSGARNRVQKALRARVAFRRGREYVVQDGRVIIVDSATGRLLPTRRFSQGLHQALEAKEGVEVRPDTVELAKTTFQEFFCSYTKLAGVTGTAVPQSDVLEDVYGLKVAVVPTRRPVNRIDHEDRLFAAGGARDEAVVDEIRHYAVDLGRPVLVGTANIEDSERIAELLEERHGLEAQVLNARDYAREAAIVESAGTRRPSGDAATGEAGTVTIATNMAGRGTDIRLGPGTIDPRCVVPDRETLSRLGLEPDPLFPPGAAKCCLGCPEADEATRCAHCFKPRLAGAFPEQGRESCRREVPCGLHVISVSRQIRRLDQQLRSRAGRQGDPGSSRFFVSMEDALIAGAPDKVGERITRELAGSEVVESKRVSKAVEQAQRAIEDRHSRIIKTLARAVHNAPAEG